GAQAALHVGDVHGSLSDRSSHMSTVGRHRSRNRRTPWLWHSRSVTPSTADADWSAYYRMTSGRPPRDLVRKGLLAAGRVGTAVDLGCGDGTETLWLLEQGWQVLAVDREPSAVELVQKRAGGA